jgi:methionine sulfoxide reductase heme-binding subunit
VTGSTDPGQHVWWLASRSMGVVAMVLVSLSVALGLAMSSRLVQGPGVAARLRTVHEALALSGLLAIVLHGVLLLPDTFLRPGLAGIAVPFVIATHRVWTGLGVIGGWLALVITASFYVRPWIGARAWRHLHRWTLAVYVLGVVHTLGAGTDAGAAWLVVVLIAAALPVAVAGANTILARGLRPLPVSPRPYRERHVAGFARGPATEALGVGVRGPAAAGRPGRGGGAERP